MAGSLPVPSLACLPLCLIALDALAAPRHGELVSSLVELFPQQAAPGVILAAARRLFWMLATMSLVWSFGILLLRRADPGEVFMELLRFMVFTGLFYWLLSGASTADGFVYAIFDSFKLMSGVGDAVRRGDNIVQVGLDIFHRVLEQSQSRKEAQVLVACFLSIAILVALTLLAAQIVLIVVMAWMLAYAGIFLLGMGGARWTSPIAISFYKHVLALGAALLLLALLLKLGQGFLEEQAARVFGGAGRNRGLDYVALADMFVVALLMSVLGIKLPGLIYLLVTGSPLGLLAGTAGMTGSALAAGGGHLYAHAYAAVFPGTGGHRDASGSAQVPGSRPDGAGDAMQAIQRAAGAARMDEVVFAPFEERRHARGSPVSAPWTDASARPDAPAVDACHVSAPASMDASAPTAQAPVAAASERPPRTRSTGSAAAGPEDGTRDRPHLATPTLPAREPPSTPGEDEVAAFRDRHGDDADSS